MNRRWLHDLAWLLLLICAAMAVPVLVAAWTETGR